MIEDGIGSQYSVFDWSNHLQKRIEMLEDRVEELEKEKIEFINEIYRVENVLDARLDTIVNELSQFRSR